MKKVQVEKIDNFTGHRSSVYAIAVQPNSAIFYSTGGDGQVVAWNATQPDLGQLVAQLPNTSYALHFDVYNDSLWVGQNYEGIHQISVKSGEELSSLKLNAAPIFAIQSTHNKLFIGSGDGIVSVIDKEHNAFVKHLKASEKSVRGLALHPNKPHLAVAYSDASIRIFDTSTFQLLHTLEGHQHTVFSVAYSPDGQWLFSGSRDATLRQWAVAAQYESVQAVPAHMHGIHAVAAHPSGKWLATSSLDKTIKIWDASSLQLLKVIDYARHGGHLTAINQVAWLSESVLLSCSDDRTVAAWKIDFYS